MARLKDFLTILCLAAGAASGAGFGAVAAEAAFSGAVAVIDGDTIDVGAVRVRLHGIDAPERDQSCALPDGGGGAWGCGAWAGALLAERFGGREAVCAPVDRDRYGRVVARCTVAGEDVGAALVREGAAFAYRRYSDAYVAEEAAARAAGRGVWLGGAVDPEKIRRVTGGAAPAAARAPAGCAIKGNVSSGGRIYHLPGQEHYDRTVIRPEQGERWFCSEAEAQAAGWRRARR